MKRLYSRLPHRLVLCVLLMLTVGAMCVSGVKGAENTTGNEDFTYEPHPLQLSEDGVIRAPFLIDYRFFVFRIVYNWTTETYSVYSLGELIVGKSSLKDIGELVAENMQGPVISSDGTYDPREIHEFFEVKFMSNATIVYYDGVEALTVVPENPPSSVITVLSPENKTYSTTDVPLEYKVNQIFYTATYSLDGQTNQTITGNTVLTGLTEGPHSIVVYIEATPGNITASKTIYFTVYFANNGNKISAPQTETNVKPDDTSTSTKNKPTDYSTDKPETPNTKEDNSNETPPTIQQDTNTPSMSTVVSGGVFPSGFLAASIGTSNLSLTYALIGILVTTASCFLTGVKLRKHRH